METKMLFVGGRAHGTIIPVSEDKRYVEVAGPPATLVEVMNDPVDTLTPNVTVYMRSVVDKGFGQMDEAFFEEDLLRSGALMQREYLFAMIRALVEDHRRLP